MEERVIGVGVHVRAQPGSFAIDDVLCRAEITVAGRRVVCQVWAVLDLHGSRNRERLVGIDQQVAELTLDAARLVVGVQAAVGRLGKTTQPPTGTVTAEAEISGTTSLSRIGRRQEVLLGDCKGCPKQTVTHRVRHHAAVPPVGRLELRVRGSGVAGITVACKGVDLGGLRARLFDGGRRRRRGQHGRSSPGEEENAKTTAPPRPLSAAAGE